MMSPIPIFYVIYVSALRVAKICLARFYTYRYIFVPL